MKGNYAMENHHKEVKFISRSILYSAVRGILVGIGVGLVVVAFRLAIEKIWLYNFCSG